MYKCTMANTPEKKTPKGKTVYNNGLLYDTFWWTKIRRIDKYL